MGKSTDDAAGASVSRPETADYDLLTFGEVRARFAELLATERGALSRLMRERQPDPAEVSRLEERISLLAASETRYRELQNTKDAFVRRFGADASDLPAAED